MIEVLVACLVIVSGILGISVLFARALGQARSALYRTAAVYLVDDLSESIRANRSALGAYTLTAVGSGSPSSCAALSAPAPGCSPEALAASDLATWSQQVKRALGCGTPFLSRAPLPPPLAKPITFACRSSGTSPRSAWLMAPSDLVLASPVSPP